MLPKGRALIMMYRSIYDYSDEDMLRIAKKAEPKLRVKSMLCSSGCLVWLGAYDTYGYGKIGVESRSWFVHRLSWILHKGTIPGRLQILHRCDIAPCWQIDHLFLGTQRDNIYDALRKGHPPFRSVRGRWLNPRGQE